MTEASRRIVATLAVAALTPAPLVAADPAPEITELDRRAAELILPSVLEGVSFDGSRALGAARLAKAGARGVAGRDLEPATGPADAAGVATGPGNVPDGGGLSAAKVADPERSNGAASSLSKPAYEDVVPALIEALSDEHADVRRFACQSLMFQKSRAAVSAVTRLLDDADRDVRHTAVRTLGWLNARDVLPRLRELYGEEKEIDDGTWVYADAFARLGDADWAIRTVRSVNSWRNALGRNSARTRPSRWPGGRSTTTSTT